MLTPHPGEDVEGQTTTTTTKTRMMTMRRRPKRIGAEMAASSAARQKWSHRDEEYTYR